MMGIVMPETCWAYKKYNKIMWHQVGFVFFSYNNEARSNKHQMLEYSAYDCSRPDSTNLRQGPMWIRAHWNSLLKMMVEFCDI